MILEIKKKKSKEGRVWEAGSFDLLNIIPPNYTSAVLLRTSYHLLECYSSGMSGDAGIGKRDRPVAVSYLPCTITNDVGETWNSYSRNNEPVHVCL